MPRRRWNLVLASATALVLAACGGTGGIPDPETTWLLVSDYDGATVQVLSTTGSLDAMSRGTPLDTGASSGPCGVAVGDGDRLYVADYDNGSILVYGLAGALAGGSPTRIATLTSGDMSGPCGLAFDSAGTLWVGDYDFGQVLGFRGVGSLSGSVSRSADVVLTVAGGAFPWVGILQVLVDAQDRLWVLDNWNETVTRIDEVTELDGTMFNLAPDLQIVETTATNPPLGGGYTMFDPASIAVDAAGSLYVGNASEDYVTRFDGAGSLAGVVYPQGSAYLVVTGVAFPYLVAIDADGALWAGNESQVARVMGPSSGTGPRTLAPTRVVTYTTTGANDGGGMTFVPMPAGLGF